MTRISGRVAALVLIALVTASCSVQPSGRGVLLGSPEVHSSPSSSPAPPPRRLEAPTETHSGKGNGTVTLTWPGDVRGFLTFDCPRCDSNVVVHTDGDEGLLVNAIGAYHGTVWFNVREAAKPSHTLSISADSAWTATIADHRSLPTAPAGKPYAGKGDAVVAIPPDVSLASFTAKNRGNTAVWVQGGATMALVVNQIGAYTGSFPVPGPTYIQVEAGDGQWTLTPQ
ncbi:hypothetical protein [Amycolatopsis sp. NPDC051903]|uniref:hypothetical protein n=1 Tax=Amycolatopsis sp. NPDC051903 TaxID=3363936 RepID=UPI0037A19C57